MNTDEIEKKNTPYTQYILTSTINTKKIKNNNLTIKTIKNKSKQKLILNQ